jgi:hypothetical protein
VLFLASISPSKLALLNPVNNVWLVSLLSAKSEPPLVGTCYIVENPLHRCKVILPQHLQKETHVPNNKCKIGTSIHQIPKVPMMPRYTIASTNGCMLCLFSFKRASMGT